MVTAMLPLDPEEGTAALAGLIETEQFCPNCVTVNPLLFTNKLPVLVLGVALDATVKANVPSPLPMAAL